MTRPILQRIALILPTLLLSSFVVFMLVHLVPGDAAVALVGEQASQERIDELHEELGLNKPLVEQYVVWASDAVRLDLGESIFTHEPVTDAVRRTLPPTLYLVAGGLLVSVLIGIPTGVAAARRAGRPSGRIVTTIVSLGVAVPSFWLALVLVSLFALRFQLFPATGFVSPTDDLVDGIKHIVLPAIALGLVGAAEISRQLRSALVEILASDHVRTLRAKGLPQRQIIWKHAMKNAAVPLLTVLGLQVNRLLGATVVVEAVFGITGVGSLVVAATQQQDIRIVQGVVLAMVVIVVAVNLLVDILYRVVDPRIR